MPLHDAGQYVFVDESGVTTDLLRRYARSLRGDRIADHTPCSLVAEHDDLEILRLSRSEQNDDKLQDTLKGDVNDGQKHGTSAMEGPPSYADRITAPYTLGE